jgi:hypothetical protein
LEPCPRPFPTINRRADARPMIAVPPRIDHFADLPAPAAPEGERADEFAGIIVLPYEPTERVAEDATARITARAGQCENNGAEESLLGGQCRSKPQPLNTLRRGGAHLPLERLYALRRCHSLSFAELLLRVRARSNPEPSQWAN